MSWPEHVENVQILFVLLTKKSETKMSASILKQDPNT